MAFDDNYNLKLLYSLAGGQPYRGRPTHVVPEAKFKSVYPSVTSEFKPTEIPQVHQTKIICEARARSF